MYNYKDKIFCVMTCMRPIEQRAFVFPAALEADYGKLPVILGGYSLGGLFALWSSMQTDRFAAIAAASPSLWIKDWLNYAEAHPVQTGKVI